MLPRARSVAVQQTGPARLVEHPGHAEASPIAAEAQLGARAGGGPNFPRVAVPVPAANDPQIALSAKPRTAVGGCAEVAIVPAILDPFGHVAVHVVEAESIGRK